VSEVVSLWQALTSPLVADLELNHPNRVHMEHESAAKTLALSLNEHLALVATPGTPPVVVCVGTDRSTGDSLGPLIGTALQQRMLPAPVYGTLEDPVHAANLAEALENIQGNQPEQPVLAVDACLGRAENVGFVSVRRGALRPGTGVNKRLPAVGHLHVVGVVNVGGFMEYLVLQNTRLSLVIRMASLIAEAIEVCLCELWLSQATASLSEAKRIPRSRVALPLLQ
jgi:putative sporulation protein YyaC